MLTELLRDRHLLLVLDNLEQLIHDLAPWIADLLTRCPRLHVLATGHGLSTREREVLRLMADGLTNQEIADALFLSPRTVTSHVTSILGKLGLSSRTAAVSFAIRGGIVCSLPPYVIRPATAGIAIPYSVRCGCHYPAA